MREKVGCAALLEKEGWKVDIKESTRRAIKYRRDSRIVIVIHDGRGWFDPLSTAKGDVFSLAEHLGAGGFTDAYDVSLMSSASSERTGLATSCQAEGGWLHAVRWRRRFGPLPGSPTWRYLTDERRIPDRIIAGIVALGHFGRVRMAACGRRTQIPADTVTGWEERGPSWRGFATGGAQGAISPRGFRLRTRLRDRSGGRRHEPCCARKTA